MLGLKLIYSRSMCNRFCKLGGNKKDILRHYNVSINDALMFIYQIIKIFGCCIRMKYSGY